MNGHLFLDKNDFVEIRKKIDAYAWAKKLYQRLREKSIRPLHTSDSQSELWKTGRRIRDAALVYAISGDDNAISSIVYALEKTFHSDKISEPLVGLDASVRNWGYGLFRGGHFWAYDLIKEHRLLRGLCGRRLEKRFAEILTEKKRNASEIKNIWNTNFWTITTIGLLGFLLGDKSAVDQAINGRYGFKNILTMLHDGFWPEATVYGGHYVSCCMIILAEGAAKNNYGDLYHYVSPSGYTLKSMFDSWLGLLFADGRLATHGDNSSQAEVVSKKEKNTGHDIGDTYFFNNLSYRECNKLEIVYRVYKDPIYAWILSKNPNRDTWDHTFWGYPALTHGIPLKKTIPPSAKSCVFPRYGCVLARSEEDAVYWHSCSPAIYVRNGSRQNHGHNDHFGLVLNAFGRNIYPDWFIQWDYSRGLYTRGKVLNKTPYSGRIIAHNTVMVDRREPDSNEATILPMEHHAEMTIVRIAGTAYRGVYERRSLGLTKEYLLDIFELTGKTKHTYDYLLHGFGNLVIEGIRRLSCFEGITKEYGLGKIDEEALSPENIWIRPGRRGKVDRNWKATFINDGIGSRLIVLGTRETEVFITNTPYFVSAYGWDDPPADGLIRKMPLLIIRRNALRTVFTVIHQPLKIGTKPVTARFHEKYIQITGEKFTDTISLDLNEFKRSLILA